tara:strand:- start:1105 stop:1323 length:219 start_codon:yes stop_codon:yes gene_type:complete
MSKNDDKNQLLAEIFALKFQPTPKLDDMSQDDLKALLANYEKTFVVDGMDLTEPTRQLLADKIKAIRSRITL